jgi:hypothetical protein
MTKTGLITSIILVAAVGALAQDTRTGTNKVDLVRASEAGCLREDASGVLTLNSSSSGQVHVELFHLPPATGFSIFRTQRAETPVGLGWHLGNVETDSSGHASVDLISLAPDDLFHFGDPPLDLQHFALWFRDAADAARTGCGGARTPFDDDHEAGIQALNSRELDDKEASLKLK